MTGAVFDWVGGRAAALARVELFRDDDTTFRWVTRADSSGRYAVRDLPAGSQKLVPLEGLVREIARAHAAHRHGQAPDPADPLES